MAFTKRSTFPRAVSVLRLTVIFVVASASGLAIGSLVPTPGSAPAATGPVRFAGREVHRFSSIIDVARTSDTVILGSVEETSPGRADGPPGQEIYFRNTYVRVEEVWLGSALTSGDRIVVETLDLQGFSRDWRVPRASVVLALSGVSPVGTGEATTPLLYRPTNTQFVFITDGKELFATQDDDFARFVATLPLGQVRERVQKAQ